METEVTTAIINATGTIAGTLIAVLCVAKISQMRNNILRLAREVEAYHKHEGRLVAKILSANDKEVSDAMITRWRGECRKEAGDDDRPSMTASEAKNIRKRHIDFG